MNAASKMGWRCLGPILIVVFMTLGLVSNARALSVMTENFPPFNYVENGELKGISVTLVRDIMARLGIQEPIEVFPWPRALRIIQTRDDCVLFSMARTPAREKMFKWVGPLVKYNVVLFKMKKRKMVLSNLDDAKKYVVGVKKDTAGHKWLIQNNFRHIHVDYTADRFPLPRMLEKGRIDLWLMGELSAPFMAQDSGVDPDLLEPAMVLFQQELYIALSRQMPESEKQKWQNALDQIIKDDTKARIKGAPKEY